ncbi:MAG: hypothetical protein ACREOU_10885 [Candidatus Eiseniibacteriota bacterium]
MDGESLRSGEGQFRGLLRCPIRGHSVFAFVNEDRDMASCGYVELRKESQGIAFRQNAAKDAPWRELRHPIVCVACRTVGTLRHFDEQGMALEMCVAD